MRKDMLGQQLGLSAPSISNER